MQRNFWKDKKVLITGYEGFLGSHLTKTLLNLQAKKIFKNTFTAYDNLKVKL